MQIAISRTNNSNFGDRADSAIRVQRSKLVAFFRKKGIRDRDDQDDLISDTRFKVFKALQVSNATSDNWIEINDFPLVWRCAKQVLCSATRRNQKTITSTNQPNLEIGHESRSVAKSSNSNSVDSSLRKIDDQDHINFLLRQIDTDDAELIRKIYFDGESRTKIASNVGVTPGHLGRREKQILQTLKTIGTRQLNSD